MSDDQINIEINGIPLKADKGAMLIEVADQADIRIPRFCYHKKLPVAANCRMCMVQVEQGGRMAPKPLPPTCHLPLKTCCDPLHFMAKSAIGHYQAGIRRGVVTPSMEPSSFQKAGNRDRLPCTDAITIHV